MLTPERFSQVEDLIDTWEKEREREEPDDDIAYIVNYVLSPPPGAALWHIVETNVKLKGIATQLGITLQELQEWHNQHTTRIEQMIEDRDSVDPDHI